MHLIKRPSVLADAEGCPEDVQSKVKTWCDVVRKAKWQHLEDVRKVYPSADKVENFLVFNLKSYRLIVGVNYQSQTVYYKYFLTH